MNRIELLAPARDVECGIAAIDCGADAVYIGAENYGARENAGNSVDDIAQLVNYAHRYWAKVYVPINTLLYDREFPDVLKLIRQFYDCGVDALIIQDTGLLECDLPPIPLIASTQMHIDAPEKVAFLEKCGFQRVILALELTLDQIHAIRKAAPRVELEYFIHGALCVCYSGQCTMSYAIGGRSANRGQCAQPCRKSYSLVDAEGTVLEEDRHLLSIRDLNLSDNLGELLDAGITSFKIEGRLKDKTYVSNIVAHYRSRLDPWLKEKGLSKSSSGTCRYDFVPDPDKTFNRGYSHYFLHDRKESLGAIDTPKMVGERIGKVLSVGKKGITLETKIPLHSGDGLCFFDRNHQLCGTFVNEVHGNTLLPAKMEGIEKGTVLFRNHDHEFLTRLEKSRSDRKISFSFTLEEIGENLRLTAMDEDGVTVFGTLSGPFAKADKVEKALATIQNQLQKTGDTEFICSTVTIDLDPVYFLPLSTINEFRRSTLEQLRAARHAQRPVWSFMMERNEEPYPVLDLSFLGNVLNRYAEAFYRRHGVNTIEPAAESGLSLVGRKVMTTKYCIKDQLQVCPKMGKTSRHPEPLSLIDSEGNRFELRFECARCEMEIYLTEKKETPV